MWCMSPAARWKLSDAKALSHIALHATLISCTTPSSLAHLSGGSISLPRIASWWSGCTRRAVDRFEMSQLQSSARSQYNLPKQLAIRIASGTDQYEGILAYLTCRFQQLVFRLSSLCKSTSAFSTREPFPRFVVAPSVRSSIRCSPLILGRPLGVHPLSVSPCLQATCHEALQRLRLLQNPVFDNIGRRVRRKGAGMTAHIPCFQRTSPQP